MVFALRLLKYGSCHGFSAKIALCHRHQSTKLSKRYDCHQYVKSQDITINIALKLLSRTMHVCIV